MEKDNTKEKEINLIKSINEQSKEYNYKLREWDVWTVYNKFTDDNYNPDGNNAIFIPTYQRSLTWNNNRKSKFIESLFLDLPIPFVFLNESNSIDDNKLTELPVHEIIDWSQRIRTISEFIDWKLKINWLKTLEQLNWYKFNDLPLILQNKFKLIPFRVVIFNWLSMDNRKEMFNRINTSSDSLNPMEVRKWSYEWDFYKIMKNLSSSKIFEKLVPLSDRKKSREEWNELVLRFLAYTNEYKKYKKYNWKVQYFLDDYMEKETNNFIKLAQEKKQQKIEEKTEEIKKQFNDMMKFVEKYLKNWFIKEWYKKSWSRVFFESISVWVWLALKEVQNDEEKLIWKNNIDELLESFEYRKIISSDWANSSKKFYYRIEIMKNFLLNKKILKEKELDNLIKEI